MKSLAVTWAVVSMVLFSAAAYADSAVVGIDFGPDSQSTPANWTSVSGVGTYKSLVNENGVVTAFDFEAALLNGSELDAYDSTPDATTIPSHRNSLDHIGGHIYSFEIGNMLSLEFSGLHTGKEYRVWVMGLRSGAGYSQTVEIISSHGASNYIQSGGNRELTVNEVVGRSSENFTSYAGIYTPATNGKISIRVMGDNGYFIAGVAIQELDDEDSCFVYASH